MSALEEGDEDKCIEVTELLVAVGVYSGNQMRLAFRQCSSRCGEQLVLN